MSVCVCVCVYDCECVIKVRELVVNLYQSFKEEIFDNIVVCVLFVNEK